MIEHQSKSKHKKKQLFNRLLAIALALTTLVSTIPPTEANASEIEDAAKNKGYGGVSPNKGDAWMGWYNQTQGYRIYMINSQLERITPVYDFFFKNPYTFYKGVASDYNVNYMKTTRFDSMSEEYYEEWGSGEFTIDRLIEWCSAKDEEGNIIGKVENPPYPYKSSKPYAGQGEKFRDWFYAGLDTLYEENEVEVVETKITPTPVGGTPTTKPTGGGSKTQCTDCNGSGTKTMTCPACKDKITTPSIQCSLCKGNKVVTIKCPTCKGYLCNVCKDLKVCLLCGGTKEIVLGTNSIACQACSATGKCQSCSSSTGGTSVCTTCNGQKTVTCSVCHGTGKYPYTGPVRCPRCLGLGKTYCTSCSTKITCSECGRDITHYTDPTASSPVCIDCAYDEGHDGKCNYCGVTTDKICNNPKDYAVDCYFAHYELEEICNNCSSGLETCSICGAGYEEGTTCSYCKCPFCKKQMEFKSKGVYYCSGCKDTISYITSSDNTIKVEIPDSYWTNTQALTTNTKNYITNAKGIISVGENFSGSDISTYMSNKSTYGLIENAARESMKMEFNAKFNQQDSQEKHISPYDALLYATGVVAGNFKWDSSSAEGRMTAYAIYQAFLSIQNSQEYKDCYYEEISLTAYHNINSLNPTSLLTVPIPLAGSEDEEKKEVSDIPAVNLMTSGKIEFPNGDYVATEKKTAMQLAMEDGCLIVVEPLCGFRMKLGEKNGEALWGKYWAYGSFWNIAQHWYGTKESYYTTFLTNLTNNCLVTSSDFTTTAGLTIYAPVGANKAIDIQDSKKMMSSLTLMYEKNQPIHGLSMHLYSMDVSQTITWDEDLVNPSITEENSYSWLIGPSPDHTERVAEEKRSDPAKYANIVKFYETTDPATGETTYKIFSREIVPRKIEIVNEENLTGYKLIEWYTTDKLCTDLSNPEITWQKLLSQAGFDRGNIAKLSIEHETLECLGTNIYEMGIKDRDGVEITENTLYLLYKVGDSTTSTYDELLGDQIGQSPDDTYKLVEKTDIEQQLTGEKYTTTPATIVKIYEELDSTNTPLSTEVFTRQEQPNTITIEDEEEQTGYQLIEWFTGSKYIEVKEEQTYTDFYEFYDSYYLKNPNICVDRQVTIAGLDPDTSEYESTLEQLFQTISFTNESGDPTGETVLYLHYIYQPDISTSTCDEPLGEPGPAPDDSDKVENAKIKANIVKYYETIDSETEELIEFSIFVRYESPTKILIEDEPDLGYSVEKWFTSTELFMDEDVTFEETAELVDIIKRGRGATEKPVNVLEGLEDVEDIEEVTLYVQLQKVEEGGDEFEDSEWILQESEISKAFETGNKTTGVSITWKYDSLKDDCFEHYLYTDGDGDDHYTFCRDWYFTDEDYAFKLKNSNETKEKYRRILAISSSFKSDNSTIEETRTELDRGSIDVKGFNYKFIAHRGDDKLSLAKYINTDNTLTELKYDLANQKNKVTRKTKSYTVELPILLVDNSTDKYTSSSGSEGCSDNDTAKTTENIKYDGKVAIRVYSGKKKTTDTTLNTRPMVIISAKSKADMTCGRQIASGAEVKFNPYIRMTYRLLDNKKKDVYVLGEYERIIIPNDYVEFEWKQEQEGLRIQSQMWALDRMLTSKSDRKAWTDSNQVLKGGATYQLTTKNQQIKLNTYQTILTGESRDICKITGEYDLSINQATEEHKNFVKETLKTLDSMELAQYVNTDPDVDFAWEDGGIKVYSGANISKLKNGSSKASTDSKYYLHSNINGKSDMSRADLDVRELETEYKFYRFYSDTSGNIYMVKSDKLEKVEKDEGSVILTKSQGETNLYEELMKEHEENLAKEIIELDKRTSVLTKLIAALERNTGNDKTASWAKRDGKWYNEAFNGIIVAVQKTTVEVGLGNEARNAVIDPKLVPQMDSKLNDEVTAFVSQYKMDFTEDTKLSTFKGQEVFMKGIEQLFSTKKFYIPSMTVQDSR